MFEHTLTKGWPWEQGIEPDAKNETAEVYIKKEVDIKGMI